MSIMEKLYQKVAADGELQLKLSEIIKDAENADKEKTEGKLTDFARTAGYDISLEEMITFLEHYNEKSSDELTDMELEAVAGGKSQTGGIQVSGNIGTTLNAVLYAAMGGGGGNNNLLSFLQNQKH